MHYLMVRFRKKNFQAIREVTNKSWVLGSDSFKETIKAKITRPMHSRSKGGDRKSKAFKGKINRV